MIHGQTIPGSQQPKNGKQIRRPVTYVTLLISNVSSSGSAQWGTACEIRTRQRRLSKRARNTQCKLNMNRSQRWDRLLCKTHPPPRCFGQRRDGKLVQKSTFTVPVSFSKERRPVSHARQRRGIDGSVSGTSKHNTYQSGLGSPFLLFSAEAHFMVTRKMIGVAYTHARTLPGTHCVAIPNPTHIGRPGGVHYRSPITFHRSSTAWQNLRRRRHILDSCTASMTTRHQV